MEAIHIWNLEEIGLIMTELEWPRHHAQVQKLIGGGHFVGHLRYHPLDLPRIWTWMSAWWKQCICEIWKKIRSKWVRMTWGDEHTLRQQSLADQTKPVFKLEWESDKGDLYMYMKLRRNLNKNDWVTVTTTVYTLAAAILLANLVIIHRTKSVFKIKREFNWSNPYLKFGRHPIKWLS